MAPIVAPDVCRYTINGTYGGENVATIIDMNVDGTGSASTRSELLQLQGEDILNAYSDNILPALVNDFVATSVTWVDLDSLDGATGETTTGGDETWPQAGAGTATQGMPGNVAALITKVAPGGGRATRNGRIYMCGISEAATQEPNNGDLLSANVTQYTDIWEQFSSDVSNTFVGDGYSSNMVVVHTRNIADPGDPPNIVYVSQSDVTAMVCQVRLATQRRRLRR